MLAHLYRTRPRRRLRPRLYLVRAKPQILQTEDSPNALLHSSNAPIRSSALSNDEYENHNDRRMNAAMPEIILFP